MTSEEIAKDELIELGIMKDNESDRIILVDSGWIDKKQAMRLAEVLKTEADGMLE